SAILWKPPAHSPEENMVRQKCSGIRRSYLVPLPGLSGHFFAIKKARRIHTGRIQIIIEYLFSFLNNIHVNYG
ncbi:hypothetical protein L8O25_22200, partial [Enterobacter asburiae]|uniref:hypothetical protein n=1 Tax=Enterobacter asburiae TaxID=61645 RepID=UPI002004673E